MTSCCLVPCCARPRLESQGLASYEQVLALDHVVQAVAGQFQGLSSFLAATDDRRPLLNKPALIVTADAGPDVQAALAFLQYGASLRNLAGFSSALL